MDGSNRSRSGRGAWGGHRLSDENAGGFDLRRKFESDLDYTEEEDYRNEEKVHRGCWASFAGCIGGMWATRQMTKKEDREIYVRTTLRELVIYTLFLGVFCIITFASTTYSMFYYTKVLTDLFVDAPYPVTRNTFRGSTQVLDFWRFTENVLLDGLYWEHWYDSNKKETEKEDRNILYENKLLGIPRMRQLRVRNDSCTIPDEFKHTIYACFDSYSEGKEDRCPFGLMAEPEWTFHTADHLGTTSTWGKLNIYSGSGSYVDLGKTKEESKEKLAILRKNLWIERGTRVVFIDFTVYNANINLFCVVKLIIEFPATGGIIPSWSFRTVKLLRYVTAQDYFVMACELIYLFFVFYYIIEEVIEISQLRMKYFRSIWNILDLLVIVLSLLCIAYNIYNYITITPALQELLEPPDKFSNFEQMGYWQVQFNSIVAVCVFFAWFKLFKYISFNKTMTQLSSTLSRCAKDVVGFAIMFFIVFFAFSQLGYLLFGTQVYDFHTFIDSVFTLLRTILGDFNFREIEAANRILGPIFFLCYVFFVFFVLLNMFLAIINDAYSEVKADIANQRNEFEIVDYFKRGYNNVLYKFGRRDKMIDLESALKLSVNDDGQLTFHQVRSTLKRCNFSDLEIEMFFAKYDCDGDKKLDSDEILGMLRDLDDGSSKTYRNTDGNHRQKDRPVSSRSVRSLPVAADHAVDSEIQGGMHELDRRVDHLEETFTEFSSRIDIVLHGMHTLEKSRRSKQEVMGKYLDDLKEDG